MYLLKFMIFPNLLRENPGNSVNLPPTTHTLMGIEFDGVDGTSNSVLFVCLQFSFQESV